MSRISRHGTIYNNHDEPIIKSSTINGPVSHPPQPSPTSPAPAVATERPQDLPLPVAAPAADDGSRRPQSPRRTRRERSIDLEDTDNVLDFLVEQENSLRRNFGEEEFNSNKVSTYSFFCGKATLLFISLVCSLVRNATSFYRQQFNSSEATA